MVSYIALILTGIQTLPVISKLCYKPRKQKKKQLL